MMVVDHGSTSGTYVGGQRIPPNQPVPLDPNGVVAFGPVPVPVSLLGPVSRRCAGDDGRAGRRRAARAGASAGRPRRRAARGPARRGPRRAAQASHGHRRAHRSSSSPAAVISIGRTPDNQIVVPHPQVSARTRRSSDQGEQLFIEDLGGRRTAPSSAASASRPASASPSRTARRSTSARCRSLIQIAGSQVERRRRGSGRSVGGQAALRDRGVGPPPRGARSRQRRAR